MPEKGRGFFERPQPEAGGGQAPEQAVFDTAAEAVRAQFSRFPNTGEAPGAEEQRQIATQLERSTQVTGVTGDPTFLRQLEIVRAAGEVDADLRHAAVMGLDGCAGDETLATLMADEDRHVRMASLLVLRRRADARLARFLHDDEPALVREAARAIHDVPVFGGMEALAGVLLDDAVHERMVITPVDEEHVELRGVVNVGRLDDAAATEAYAKALSEAAFAQWESDVPIWEHKVYRETPALNETESAIAVFRRWYAQFYAEAGL